MSKELLKYQGYEGSVEYSLEDDCLYGRILFIGDRIVYEASTIPELRRAFASAVDAYIETCSEIGKQPEKPCSGVFQVRIGSEQHRKALRAAYKQGVSLNEFVKCAIDESLKGGVPVLHYHNYRVVRTASAEIELPHQDECVEWPTSVSSCH